jgi:hypothetical protein
MGNPHFIARECCPGCDSPGLRTLYSNPFTEPPIRGYLEGFYRPQGGIQMDLLKGATYILDRCDECGLVYQREAPDDFILSKLYEEWTDPTRGRHETDSLEYFVNLADEVATMTSMFDASPSSLRFLDFGMGSGLSLASGMGPPVCHDLGATSGPTVIAVADCGRRRRFEQAADDEDRSGR